MEHQTQRPSPSPSTAAETNESRGRLQRLHAPAALQLNAGHSNRKGWENGTPSRSPIPLLSPLFVARAAAPLMEGDGEAEQENERPLASTEAGVWRHPVTSPGAVTEPAGLVPLFQSQCGLRP